MRPIPVIDIFAGPGGLGEGFSALRNEKDEPAFKIRLSIEKEAAAHATLELRSFFRQFQPGAAPDAYYQHLRGELSRQQLFEAFPREAAAAQDESWLQELGPDSAKEVSARIGKALGGIEDWVLIGGPPCQAYSLAGRSRNKGVEGYDPSKDVKQTLYIEYLQILADHGPAVFVMENVKGLLSASHRRERLFDRIVHDLQDPATAIRREGRRVRRGAASARYVIHSLVPGQEELFQGPSSTSAGDFVLRSELYGIPQARHRVILVGVRADYEGKPPKLGQASSTVTVGHALEGLPRVRSGLSGVEDSDASWRETLSGAADAAWFLSLRSNGDSRVYDKLTSIVSEVAIPQKKRGGNFIAGDVTPEWQKSWFHDPRLGGVVNHSTRSHIPGDLHRYLFVSTFGSVRKRSPTLSDFPKQLLPAHANVGLALGGGHFADRFRVQISSRPSTTITSHISKDGHYYIHPDPTQCRSLTVREAARLQTFPDNYFFTGGRTDQYVQVGNAVPPLLARQIARSVLEVFR